VDRRLRKPDTREIRFRERVFWFLAFVKGWEQVGADPSTEYEGRVRDAISQSLEDVHISRPIDEKEKKRRSRRRLR
jgi:hypothetical protein